MFFLILWYKIPQECYKLNCTLNPKCLGSPDTSGSQTKLRCNLAFVMKVSLGRVATVREKSGKNKNFSRSGKSQGILQKVRENLSSCQSQWKVREFCFQVGARFCEDYENIFIPKIKLQSIEWCKLCVQMQGFWSVVFIVNAFFQIRKRNRKKLGN